MASQSTSLTRAREFEQDVRTAVLGLRGTLNELVNSVGADPTHAQDMARRFGLNKNLTWKISKIIREADPYAAVTHIPGKSGLNIVMRSLKSAGASDTAVASFCEAIEEFNAMVDLHSGDRETLEIMLGDLTSEGQREREEAYRRIAYRGNSATWGVRARVQLCVNFIAPSRDAEDMIDLGWLSGLVDFRRLRADASWMMASARKIADDGSALPLGSIGPLDPSIDGTKAPPLVKDFCSQPLPNVRLVHGPDGLMSYELAEGRVGNTGALSCIIGLYGRAFQRRHRVEKDTLGEHAARLFTPVEVLIHDFFVHEELTYAHSPSMHLYSYMPGGPSYPASGRDRGLLPLSETAHEAGSPADIVTPELPDYRRMLKKVTDRMGVDPRRFRGYRFRLAFPPIPTLAIYRYELPE